MQLVIVLCLLLLLREASPDDQVSFLTRFGYLPTISNGQLSANAVELAIRKFQRVYGLPISGRYDSDTQQAMQEPRCASADIQTPNRSKRSSPFAWHQNNVTYGVSKWSRHLPPSAVEDIMKRAFEVWEKETDLRFRRDARPMIEIQFGTGWHDCSTLFDPMVLAHAFPPMALDQPTGGDIHFNEQHTWTMDRQSSNRRVSLLSVATHEIGHALGLHHNVHDIDSIMHPRDLYRKARITERDRQELQRLYGTPHTVIPSPTRPLAPTIHVPVRDTGHKGENGPDAEDTERPDPCRSTVDAVGTLRGEQFIFKNEWVWRVSADGRLVHSPSLISDVLPNVPYPVNAAVEIEGTMWMFVGTGIYVVHVTGDGLRMMHAPLSLSHIGIADDAQKIDMAFRWHYFDPPAVYLWSGDQYWKFDALNRMVEQTYPRHIKKSWMNVPEEATAAFSKQKELYFVKGEELFRMNTTDWRLPVAKGYPLPISSMYTDCGMKKTTRAIMTRHQRSSLSNSCILISIRYFVSSCLLFIILNIF